MVEHFRLMFLQVLAAPAPAPAAGDTGLVMLIATFISQVKVNGFVAFAIQKLKESKTPALNWISTNTPGVTRFVAAAAAAGTALGVHLTFTGNIWSQSGATYTVAGLSVPAILTYLYNVAQNYLFQHAWYKQIFAPPPTGVAGGLVAQMAAAGAPTGKGGAGVPGGD